jgi:hypothetical protein
MMDDSDSESPVPVSESAPKKKKAKKRPSDFEIMRTIITRTHERKLPFLFKNMGEDPDILFMCSGQEDDFSYGSPDLAVAVFEITDPELSTVINTFLNKLHGLSEDHGNQCIINMRDQISELAKTKGESIDVEVESNGIGSVWTTKTDTNGKERTLYYSKVVESLFHVQMVRSWCKDYRPLLTTEDPAHLYYPYRHPDSPTGSIVRLPPHSDPNHPLVALYPNGFRTMATKGLDVITDSFLNEFPYPIVSEDLIVFNDHASVAVKIAHRIIAEGWRMVLLRPNAVYFPTLSTVIPLNGNHSL